MLNLKPPQLKVARYWLALALAGVMAMLLGGLWNTQERSAGPKEVRVNPQGTGQDASPQEESATEEALALARDLERVLSKVRGTGQVSVVVKLESGSRKAIAESRSVESRKTEEKDDAGGSRVITETSQRDQPVLARGPGDASEAPIILETSPPVVKGVLVVAEGAADPGVKAELIRAVATLLDLPYHRITVLAGKAGG